MFGKLWIKWYLVNEWWWQRFFCNYRSVDVVCNLSSHLKITSSFDINDINGFSLLIAWEVGLKYGDKRNDKNYDIDDIEWKNERI